MDQNRLQRRLFAAARSQKPDERVPYAFEQRIMARVRGRAVPDIWAAWSRGMWRAAVSCVVLAVALSAWSWFEQGTSPYDLSQDFENTVFAAADQDSSAEMPR